MISPVFGRTKEEEGKKGSCDLDPAIINTEMKTQRKWVFVTPVGSPAFETRILFHVFYE